MQNRFNLIDREHEAVLDYCTNHQIGFIPWFPLAAGDLAGPGQVLGELAKRYNVSPSQMAIAWLLRRSPVMLPIPGTSKVSHLEANIAAASLKLSDNDFEELNRATSVNRP